LPELALIFTALQQRFVSETPPAHQRAPACLIDVDLRFCSALGGASRLVSRPAAASSRRGCHPGSCPPRPGPARASKRSCPAQQRLGAARSSGPGAPTPVLNFSFCPRAAPFLDLKSLPLAGRQAPFCTCLVPAMPLFLPKAPAPPFFLFACSLDNPALMAVQCSEIQYEHPKIAHSPLLEPLPHLADIMLLCDSPFPILPGTAARCIHVIRLCSCRRQPCSLFGHTF
jgi:hypothetical protein